ncbi:MAG: putative immunity protein [Candidatus Woesearchaeota archaeon]
MPTKISKVDQRELAIWAAKCAEHVLPYFEREYPNDSRPRKAIEVCRTWIRTGVFSMKVIRGASLSAHAAARDTKKDSAALYAARACGQAVATAHVGEHAFGPSYYALKIAAIDPDTAEVKIAKELKWQSQRLPKHLIKTWKDFQLKRFPKKLKELIKKSAK